MIHLAFIFIMGSCSNSKVNNDCSILNLKGNIKFVKEINYGANERFGEIDKEERFGLSELLFDRKGNIVEQKSYDKNESLTEKVLKNYNEKGNIIETNTYDSKGQLISKIKYEHNVRGVAIEEKVYDYNGKLLVKRMNTHDDKGNIIESNSFLSDDVLGSKDVFVYSNSNLIEVRSFKGDGALATIWNFKYDNKNNKVESNFVSESPFSEFNKKIKFSYKYEVFDKNGNWIKRIEYEDEIPKSITEREIEYY